jgi:hypothetical protein
MAKGQPKRRHEPANKEVRTRENAESYLQQTPVWRFSDFDWEGPFGLDACRERGDQFVSHFRDHLAHFESMTWAEILRAAGGRRIGNNHHPIPRDKFTRQARDRLEEKGIKADELFSFRFDQATRIYGVRQNNVLRIVFFDPFHDDPNRAAYQFNR